MMLLQLYSKGTIGAFQMNIDIVVYMKILIISHGTSFSQRCFEHWYMPGLNLLENN